MSSEIKTYKNGISNEEYLAFEEKAVDKHEYHNGTITTMAGGTIPHNKIASNIIRTLDNWVEANKLDYIVLNSDTKIRIQDFNKNVYPDAVVVCKKPQYWKKNKSIIENPLLVFEVLSPSTQDYDKGEKFAFYRSLPSFQEYVLFAQNKARADAYFRKNTQVEDLWKISAAHGLDAHIRLESLGFDMPLQKVYWRVKELVGGDWVEL